MTPLDTARHEIVCGMTAELLSTLSDEDILDITGNMPERPWKSMTVRRLWFFAIFNLGVIVGLLV